MCPSALARSTRIVLLTICLILGGLVGVRTTAGDGFTVWDKTRIWNLNILVRDVHWVEGHGWWVAAQGSFFVGYDNGGLLLKSGTGADGWSGNLLADEWPHPLFGIAHSGNKLMVVGMDTAYAWDLAAGSFVRGVEWEPAWGDWNDRFMWGASVAYGNGVFAATDALCLDGGSGVIHTTVDGHVTGGGRIWTPNLAFLSPAMPQAGGGGDEWDWPGSLPLCYGSGRFVGASRFGWIITSANGLDWQNARMPMAHQETLYGVAEKGGVFVAVGAGGAILRSTDGTAWRRCATPTTADLLSVAAGVNWFMAVGADETVLISADGQTWTQIPVSTGSDPKARYTAVGAGNGRFLIATSDGESLLSGTEPLPVGIRVSPPGAGTASFPDQGILMIPANGALDVTAVATPGYHFAGWSGDVVQDDAHLSAVVTAPLALTANFVRVVSQPVDFREGPSLQEPRMGHRAVDLDGRTVLLGGHSSGFVRSGTMDQANLDAGTGDVVGFGLFDLGATADGAAVATLADGTVLVVGGAQADFGIAPGIDTAMIVSRDEAGSAVATLAGSTMTRPRMNASATRLASGKVLIVGGWWDLASATYGELYTPPGEGREEGFAETGPLAMPRSAPLVLPTANGGAIVAGGSRTDLGHALRVESYDPFSNTFSTVADTLLGDGEPWVLNTRLPGDVSSQLLPDGTYLLWGWHETTREGCLFVFDPTTRAFQRRALVPPLEEVGDRTFPPVLDAMGGYAYLVTGVYDMARPESQFRVHAVHLATGKRTTNSVPFTVAGYYPNGATVTGFQVDGTTRLLLAGGSSDPGHSTNFHAVSRTFVFDPVLSLAPGDATTVSLDYHGFLEQADNVRMARGADGALHLTYTRAVRAPSAPDWYSYARTRDADGDWQPETRTERFPDSNTANSILVDDAGNLHQGFTFNVGAFHTQSTDGGGTWSQPVPVRDGGWGSWDYDTRLARYGSDVYAVFHSCFGWGDFPANLMLRRWNAAGGWGSTWWLTELPNEDSSGYGVQSPRFQICPDGRGVVLFTESLAASPTQVKLLDVGLPYGGAVPYVVSQPGRWAAVGDVAVDSGGTAHIVWREADDQAGPYELWYRSFTSSGGLAPPVSVSEAGEASVRSATVGAYPGNRILAAYGIQGERSAYGGVFVRKVDAGVSPRVRIGRTANAHSPGLRSTWDMESPDTVDLTWVEVYSWGSQLQHREFAWDEVGVVETGTATVRSNVLDATFTLTGPVSGDFSLVDGVLALTDLPLGTYRIVWHPKAGQTPPPPQSFSVTGDGDMEVAASYIDENLHRVTTLTSPAGAGEIAASPPGVLLLGNDRAYADGPVTFSARPVEGQAFVRWRLTSNQGVAYWTDHPLTVAIDRDFEVQAEFEEGGPFRVDTSLSGEGTITPGAVVPSGSRFVCDIVPAAGHQVQGILLDGEPQEPAAQLVIDPVTGDHSIEVFAEPADATVVATVLPEAGGDVTVTPETYALGDTVLLEANPATGFRFVEWRGDVAGNDRSVDLLVDGPKAATAFFLREDLILGDLNDDGAISIDDAVLARRMYAGQMPVDLARGDMNGDGQLDTDDILAILQAEAGSTRPCLGAQDVAQAAEKRLVTFPSGIGLTFPANWPDSTRRASVARGVAAELPALPPPLQALSPIYDIRVAGVSSFGREIGLTFPGLGGRRRDDPVARVLHLHPERDTWVTVGTGVAGDTFSVGERSGKYVVAAAEGSNTVRGTHCVVHYDPTVLHTIAGNQVSGFSFALVVADRFDAVFDAYRAAGYNLPGYERSAVDLFLGSVTLDWRADVYLSDASNTYKEPTYSWKSGNYYAPATMESEDDLRFALAHEMFHAIQNRIFNGAAMDVNRWLMEMTAEYASRKGPHNEALSGEYGVWLGTRLGTLDDIHEYACAHFLHYLLGQGGGSFKDLWNNRLATSYTPHGALRTYARDRAKGSLSMVYARYLYALLFDTAVADVSRQETTMPPNGTPWGPGNMIETTVTVPTDQAMGWMRTQKPPAAPLRILLELTGGVPERVNARVYQVPYDSPRAAGGRMPLDSFFNSETLPFVGTVLGADDSVYVTAYNYFGGARSMPVRIRPLRLVLTQTPATVASGTPCQFKATVDIVPDSVHELRAYWKATDGKAWQIDTLPAARREFEHTHTFVTDKDKTFQMTFELYGLDKDGRRGLIASQTLDVPVAATPMVEIVPAVSRLELNQMTGFATIVKNGPDNPWFRWTFGDGSAAAEGPDVSVAHRFVVAGEFTVAVALADASAPTVVLAQCKALVVVNPPPQVVDPGPEPDPDAPPLDYANLRQVDQDRGFIWDDAREVFYVDAAGTKQGLYRSYIPKGGTMAPLEVGMYIDGRKEGRWLIYWQDGTGRVERRHFHQDLWVGSDSTAHDYQTLASVSGTIVSFSGAGLAPMDWPAALAGNSWRINYLDGSYEEVAFDTAGRRHGHCVIRNSADQILMEGDFAAGVKTGVWKYFVRSGATATGVSYNHDQDPPNHE